ncbi:MAG: FAD-binding protein, partial [Gammaproteobacteria bacterium]
MIAGGAGFDESVGQACAGRLLMGEKLDKYTSWRVGGPADRIYFPEGRADLQAFLRGLPEGEPTYWIGLGSNLLVRDGGIRGTVISTRGCLKEMKMLESDRVYVEAGVHCAKAARFCCDRGLTGAEFMAGIPGTVGGALKMNAGAFGGETWRIVESVDVIDGRGAVRTRSADEFDVGYRSVKG